MVRELTKNLALGVASAGAVGGGSAASGEVGAMAVGLGLAGVTYLLSRVSRSELEYKSSANGRAHTAMAAIATAGTGALIESLYWVRRGVTTAVNGLNNQIHLNDLAASNNHLVQAVSLGLIAGSILAVTIPKAFRKETKQN